MKSRTAQELAADVQRFTRGVPFNVAVTLREAEAVAKLVVQVEQLGAGDAVYDDAREAMRELLGRVCDEIGAALIANVKGGGR